MIRRDVWSPTGIVRLLFPSGRATQRMARRWSRATAGQPELLDDLIRLGGVLEMEPRDAADPAIAAPTDAVTMAFAAGRRDLALQLLALARVDPTTLDTRMENDHAPHDDE